MAYPDPYPRPAPDHFVRRWLFITACIAALMLLWQFLPAIEAWFSPREAADRTVTARAICQAASDPARPAPMIWMASLIMVPSSCRAGG